jgi:hypothetical protein
VRFRKILCWKNKYLIWHLIKAVKYTICLKSAEKSLILVTFIYIICAILKPLLSPLTVGNIISWGLCVRVKWFLGGPVAILATLATLPILAILANQIGWLAHALPLLVLLRLHALPIFKLLLCLQPIVLSQTAASS